MIILDTTTRSLEVLLAATVATNQLPITAAFVDVTTTVYTPISSNTVTNNTTAVTIVSAPAASTQRQIKFFTVYNADTTTATLTLRYNDNATTRIILKATLAIGDTLTYTDGKGFTVTDSSGNTKGSGSSATSALTKYTPTIADADNTISEITLLQFTIPANTFLDGQVIRSTYISKFKQNKGTSGTITYKLYWGSNSVTIVNALTATNDAGENQELHGFYLRRSGTTIYLSDGQTGYTGAFSSRLASFLNRTDEFASRVLTSQTFTADTIVKLTLTMSAADALFYEHMITAEAFKW